MDPDYKSPYRESGIKTPTPSRIKPKDRSLYHGGGINKRVYGVGAAIREKGGR